MPHESKTPPASLPADEYTAPGEIPLQAPDYKLTRYVPEDAPARQYANRTSKGFVGRIASGQSRVISADDSSYAIESDKPLTAGEIALAQRNGFDDLSEGGTGQIMVADKAEVRRVNGDINHIAYALTGRDAGRSR